MLIDYTRRNHMSETLETFLILGGHYTSYGHLLHAAHVHTYIHILYTDILNKMVALTDLAILLC